MRTSTYSPFLYNGVIFRKESSGEVQTAQQKSEFKAIRESKFLTTKRGDSYQLCIQLPGLWQRNLSVNLNKNLIKITGIRSYISSKGSRRKKYKFQQTFYVDNAVDKDKITADLKDEELILSAPFITTDESTVTFGVLDKGANPVTEESEIKETDSIDLPELLPSSST